MIAYCAKIVEPSIAYSPKVVIPTVEWLLLSYPLHLKVQRLLSIQFSKGDPVLSSGTRSTLAHSNFAYTFKIYELQSSQHTLLLCHSDFVFVKSMVYFLDLTTFHRCTDGAVTSFLKMH